MILHQCTKNYDMMFDCRDMAQDKHIILGKFLPFNPVTGLKKTLEILWFHTSVSKIMTMFAYSVMAQNKQRGHFRPIFALLLS